MNERCTNCGSKLLELWSKGKIVFWLACPVCDKQELDYFKQVQRIMVDPKKEV